MTGTALKLAPFSVALDPSGAARAIVRRGLFLIFVVLGSFTAWGTLAPLSGAVIADGRVKIESSRKTVQHLEGGIVKEILVREGDHVATGQPLIRLENTVTSANLNILQDQLDALLAKQARLQAEATIADSIDFPQELLERKNQKNKEIVRAEQALFTSKRKTLNDQIGLTQNQIEEAKRAVAGFSAEINAIELGIQFAGEELAATEELTRKKLLEKTHLWNIQRIIQEKKERLGAENAELARERQMILELQLKIINLRNEYSKGADDELKETKKAIYEVEERLKPAKDALTRQTISAPISGQVIDLKVTTVAGVIRPSDPLMDIVPTVVQVVMAVKVKTKDVANVYVRQPAEVQLSAYNQQTTPMLRGEVIYVSGDALADDKQSPPEPYYLAHIRVDQEALRDLSGVTLAPGMPIVGFIQTRSKTFFEYLLSPFIEQVRRSFQET
ncbi:MAG: HlyD family type I secretion periplasmic adaptor subunit [Gammaproteobacteria bacterium]